MTNLLIKNGRVIDPANDFDGEADVLIRDGRIETVEPGIVGEQVEGIETLDATGLVVTPGLIDIHVHLREPGLESKETIATGTASAANGGFTTICPMPNTQPVIDSATGLNYVRAIAERDGLVRVLPIAAVTRGSLGEEITEFGDLAHHGAVAFSDDGMPVYNAQIMRVALEYTKMLGRPVLNHSEIIELVGDGVAHDGAVASRLGLRGTPRSAETACVARDIELAAETGGHVHICHVSTGRACELIAEAKKRGVRVTAEVTPHHLTLTEEMIEGFNTYARVAPPLRAAEDRDALRAALIDGTLDCIATDHAPHTEEEKDLPFDQAPPGMIALDFAFAQCYDSLVASGDMDLPTLIHRMSTAPAGVLSIDGGTLAKGAIGDVTVIDLKGETRVERDQIKSRSFNTPLRGRTFKSSIAATIVGGKIVHKRDDT